LISKKAFFYYQDDHPGLGILASHEYEGWQRVNFYSFGLDIDDLQKELEEECEEQLLQESVIAARPAQSKVIIAGGVVFKSLTCLAGEGVEATEVLKTIERRVPDLRTLNAADMEVAASISPLEIYCFTYKKKIIGIARVVFFEYATQMSLLGVYREQDRNLVEELYRDISGLHDYMTVPSPLRTDEEDARVEVNMFMIRSPLKEELQADFVEAIFKIPGLDFFSV
jgi:hypothetical protein